MQKIRTRKVILSALIFFSIVQGIIMVEWVQRWGFFGAIVHWFETFNDPISAAANIDLIVLALSVAVWMIWREGKWNKTLTLILLPYILYPSLGLLIYLIISDKNLPGDNR